MERCIDCLAPTRTACTNCNEPWCPECNEDLNITDGEEGDGMCWQCRERAAGTYDGVDKKEAADWLQELNEDYCNSRL